MDICIEEPHPREKIPSVLEIKNKIRLGHDECCNCCCCKAPQFQAYKYVQPDIPKSFRPIEFYCKSELPMENNTTYKMSFWPCPGPRTKPILPETCLSMSRGPFAKDTTHNLSYVGNWCIEPQKKILPCSRQLFDEGPLQDLTTQKHDFGWKYGPKGEPIIYRGNLCLPKGNLQNDTTYKLSYFPATCLNPVKSFRPIRHYEKSDVPIEESTTYRLSFFHNEPSSKEIHPWMEKQKFEVPTTPVEACTTYKLSYWPQCAERVEPIIQTCNENILNKKSCDIQDETTYNLSYFGGDGDKPQPIVPPEHKIFDDCPASHDTVNRMSYLGNWCQEPVKPILPCSRQLLTGDGPIQDDTTQKCHFTWKYDAQQAAIRPMNNLTTSPAPLESCTTNRLSYVPNCNEYLLPNKSFAPIRKYEPSSLPMDNETITKLSFQAVPGSKVEKPWAYAPPYQKPTTRIDDHTTYDLSFMAPGQLVPCCPSETPCPIPANSCCTQPVSTSNTRPCISC